MNFLKDGDGKFMSGDSMLVIFACSGAAIFLTTLVICVTIHNVIALPDQDCTVIEETK